MRSTLLVLVLAGAAVTAGCSVLLPPKAQPCITEQNTLNGAKSMKSLADAEALDANVKALNAAQAKLQATIDQSDTERAAADAANEAAEDDVAATQAQAEKDAKAVTDAEQQLDACRQQHPDN